MNFYIIILTWQIVILNGKLVSSISSRAFSTAIYENLRWKKEFSFKFRGITKERGMSKMRVLKDMNCHQEHSFPC